MENERQKEPIGEILVRRGKITAEQLESGLAMQAKSQEFIGEILVGMGCLEEADIVAALIIQCGFPYIAVNKYTIDSQVISLVPAEFARRFHMIPLDRVGNILSVVMADPLNHEALRHLSQFTQYTVAPFIATKSEIEKAIEHYYGKKT